MNTNHSDNRIFEFPHQNTGFDAEMAYAQKSRGGCYSCGCCLGCLGLLLLILLGIAAICYSFVSGGATLVVSEETTIITEPLKSDGETVDFHRAIQAMFEPEVQPDANGFRDVLLGYGQEIFERWGDGNNADWQYLEMCKELGIDPEIQPTLFLFRLTPNNIQQWLADVGKGLDAVQVAAAKPRYFVPMVRRSERDLVVTSQPLAVYAFHEDLSKAFRLRADIQFLSEGDIASAWKDTLTSLRLFRLVSVNHAWMKALGGIDDESLLAPVSEIVDTLTLPQWTPERLNQAIRDLETLPDWQDRQTTLKILQFYLLDLLSATRDPSDLQHRLHGRLPIEARQAVELLRVFAFDWNLVAKELNSEIKAYGELMERAAGQNLDEQFDLLRLRPIGMPQRILDEEEWKTFTVDHLNRTGELPFFAPGRSKLTGAMAGYLVTWAAGEMYRLQLIEDSRCQALRLALALERFHREQGQYPDSLAELGLQPMALDMHLQYEKRGTGYRIQNKVFQLAKE